jgi:hypothetical protein
MIYFLLSVFVCSGVNYCQWYAAEQFVAEADCQRTGKLYIRDVEVLAYRCTVRIYDAAKDRNEHATRY